MTSSRFIAGLMGPVMIALGGTMFANPGLFGEVCAAFRDNVALVVFSGALILALGLAVVRTHRSWAGWSALVTLIGWLMVLGGIVRMFAPHQVAEFAVSLAAGPAGTIAPAIMVLLGLFLSFMAYRPAR